MFRAVIAGCRNIARVHAAVLHAMENVTIAAFADVVLSRAEEFQKEYGGNVYTSIEEMLDKEKPDVLHICLPHYLHVPVTEMALKKGVKVFMEKPPVITWEEYEHLAQIQDEKRLGICFQNRYNPCSRKAKEIIDSGAAGKVLGCRGLVTWYRDLEYYTSRDWRDKIATAGGGMLANQSIHTMDLMNYISGGKPVAVMASNKQHHLAGQVEVEDMMEARIQYENGAIGYYFGTSGYIEDSPPIIEIFCENMKIRVEDPELTVIYPDGRKEQPELPKVKTLGKGYWGSGHGACIGAFYEALEKGEKAPVAWEDVKDIANLMLSAYEAAESGTEVKLR